MQQMKRPHPALSFSKAQLRSVKVGDEDFSVWMAPDIDQLLNDFIETSKAEGDALGQQRCPLEQFSGPVHERSGNG